MYRVIYRCGCVRISESLTKCLIHNELPKEYDALSVPYNTNEEKYVARIKLEQEQREAKVFRRKEANAENPYCPELEILDNYYIFIKDEDMWDRYFRYKDFEAPYKIKRPSKPTIFPILLHREDDYSRNEDEYIVFDYKYELDRMRFIEGSNE